MYPILFRVPLPSALLPWFWALLGAGIIAFLFAVYQLVTKNKSGAGVAAFLGVLGIVGAFWLKGETWQLGPTPIYSYGVMLGLSLVVGWYLTLGLAERDGLPKETMANTYVVTALAAIAGSRILYVLTNLNEFDSMASVFAMRRGGLVAYGGFLGGLAGSFFFLRRHKIPLLPWADVAVPSLASGLMITRIGCYLFGCDFGRPLSETAPGWLKKLGSFPHWPDGTLEHGEGSPAWHQHVVERGLARTAEHSLPVHPTQIYESLVGLGLLALLLVVRRKQKFRGEIFFLFAFAYGVCRFLLELLRDDNERGSLPPSLPEHILIPLCMVIFAVGFVIGFSKLIQSMPLRRLAQGASFLPALALYLKMRPESFGMSTTVELSTSQFVAVTTGFAACAAFALFYKAAMDHPETAMALGLPVLAPAGGAPLLDEEDDEDDDDRAERRPARGRARVAAKSKIQPRAEGDVDDAGTVKAKSGTNGAKKKAKAKAKSPSASDVEGNAEIVNDDEPAKTDEPTKDDSVPGEGEFEMKAPTKVDDAAKKDAPSESEEP